MLRSNILRIALIIGIQIGIQSVLSISNAFNSPYCINNEQKQAAIAFTTDFLKMDQLFKVLQASDPDLESSFEDSDLEVSESEARSLYTENQYKLWKISKELNAGKMNSALACDYINILSYERNQHQKMPLAQFQLTQPEAMSLYAYAADLFKIINPALRGQTTHLKQIKSIIKHLDLALLKLPPYKGKVLRGVNFPKNIPLKVGAIFSDPGYLSTSISNPYGGTHKFIIHSKTGRKIEAFSPNPQETEVLFMRNTPFKISSIHKTPGLIVVELVE